MTTDPRKDSRAAEAWLQQLHEFVDALNVAFLLAAFLFAVLSLVWAVHDRSVAELVCAFGLFLCGAGLLTGFIEKVDGTTE
ncbi:hypothetical protein [Azospirillum rugosum]|uniref:Uncharacterized protein n=1 Tax=Azospirillum rugosum TaxID=416170 RepID=A0ABS4SI46_9PROT|nr:hypothetical protein [Azospirillum rugosum]MBP2292245.1 hypothetical protein [Azospirillum rugosum]MDQ0526004.1 hypothetical protein [Azospirillum rugosum]